MSAESESIHVDAGEFTAHDGMSVIAEGTAQVTAQGGTKVDAWDEAVVDAMPGSQVVIWSKSVTVRQHQGSRVVSRAQGTVLEVALA